MFEGMRYWYVHASSEGRWKERIRPMLPRWGEPSGISISVLNRLVYV